MPTVKPRPEAHMDMILFEVFLKSIDLIPQQQIYYNGTIYIIDNVIVLRGVDPAPPPPQWKYCGGGGQTYRFAGLPPPPPNNFDNLKN